MAVFTALAPGDASRVAVAHGLGPVARVVPIPAGSVNSNFFLETADGRWFFRIYEEQDVDGVAYEWALLDHLRGGGVPVPMRVPGAAPGAVRVAGKPTAVFECVTGVPSCQAAVTTARAREVGKMLGAVHRAAIGFPQRRAGRFTLADVGTRLDVAESAGRAELVDVVPRLRRTLEEVQTGWPSAAPVGVIHGDLFRDNVFWDGDHITAVIDWESASDGALGYDLMVAVLAWCVGDGLDLALARALVTAYASVRPLEHGEPLALHVLARAAALRFAATRITDYHLRAGGVGDRVIKDYRRFVARLDAVEAMSPPELAQALGIAERISTPG
jgi:homoserine kinase type II